MVGILRQNYRGGYPRLVYPRKHEPFVWPTLRHACDVVSQEQSAACEVVLKREDTRNTYIQDNYRLDAD